MFGCAAKALAASLLEMQGCVARKKTHSSDPSQARHFHLVVECGIHGQWNNPAKSQCSCSTEAETGFVPTFSKFFAVRTLLDTEVSTLDSFLYPEVPRVGVFRSLSCSQSIRQRICRQTVTLHFILHWNSQILVHRFHSASPTFKAVKALKRRSRFHSAVTDLSHQSRALPRDWVASKAAVHEDCDLVNMFLSSKSQRCFGLSHQIPRCTFQRDNIELQDPINLGPNAKLCLAVSRVVCFIASVFVLHPDSLMMSGACLK